MHIFGEVNHCDFEDKDYPLYTEGIHFFAQGATGRFCWVMSMGPDCEGFNKYAETTMTIEELETRCEELGGWLNY
jgi:hypothetical protein